ncbi:MAG TPA: DUF1844 domain-containing protein [Tepidisphaeraceae bacterium]|nr:DUF1844 domain-containing protein [Tepidisphaeraceae bacterium]
MADEKPSLHIDTDWKKQAQEEKRRLAEQAAAKSAAPVTPGAEITEPAETPEMAAGRGGGRQRGQMPAASFVTLVQSLMTQALFYLGDLTARGAEPSVNLDMAKHQIDTLGVLEEKSKGNLTEDEQRLLDTALYEVRMRYVNVASQFT